MIKKMDEVVQHDVSSAKVYKDSLTKRRAVRARRRPAPIPPFQMTLRLRSSRKRNQPSNPELMESTSDHNLAANRKHGSPPGTIEPGLQCQLNISSKSQDGTASDLIETPIHTVPEQLNENMTAITELEEYENYMMMPKLTSELEELEQHSPLSPTSFPPCLTPEIITEPETNENPLQQPISIERHEVVTKKGDCNSQAVVEEENVSSSSRTKEINEIIAMLKEVETSSSLNDDPGLPSTFGDDLISIYAPLLTDGKDWEDLIQDDYLDYMNSPSRLINNAKNQDEDEKEEDSLAYAYSIASAIPTSSLSPHTMEKQSESNCQPQLVRKDEDAEPGGENTISSTLEHFISDLPSDLSSRKLLSSSSEVAYYVQNGKNLDLRPCNHKGSNVYKKTYTKNPWIFVKDLKTKKGETVYMDNQLFNQPFAISSNIVSSTESTTTDSIDYIPPEIDSTTIDLDSEEALKTHPSIFDEDFGRMDFEDLSLRQNESSWNLDDPPSPRHVTPYSEWF